MKKTVKKLSKFFLLLSLFLFKGYSFALAQTGVNNAITSAAETIKTTTGTVVKSLVAVVLFIGLIIMIYKVATSDQRSRDWVIGWVAAALIYGVALTIISAIGTAA